MFDPLAGQLALAVTGLIGGVLASFLGIGGGLFLFPAILFVSRQFFDATISIQEITGLTTAGSLFSSLYSFYLFRRDKTFYGSLIRYLAPGIIIFGFLGGMASKVMPASIILIMFMLFVAFNLVTILSSFRKEAILDDFVADERLDRLRSRLLALGAGVGFYCSVVGLGGAVLVIAISTRYLKLGIHQVIGSSLGISTLTFALALAGKVVTDQVPYLLTPAICAGILVGVPVGYRINKATSPRWIKLGLVIFLVVILLKSLFELLR